MPGIPATDLQTTNISDTYYGLLHAGGVPIPSSGQHLIRDGSGTPTALRLGANCNGATICGNLSATNKLRGKELDVETLISPGQLDVPALIKIIYPINAVIYTANGINPGTRANFAGTTWEQIAQGRFIVGVGEGTDNKGVARAFASGNTYGEYFHTLTVGEMPTHTHSLKVANEQFYITNDGNNKDPTSLGRFRSQGPSNSKDGRYCNTLPSTGGSDSHNNMPPGYGLWVWQRTA